MKRTGTVYVTIRKKLHGGWGGDPFTVVRASTRRHKAGPGEVEIPIEIKIDDAWFTPRVPVVTIEIEDRPPMEIQARESTRR